MAEFDYGKYLAGLLIIQYAQKAKAVATIESVAKMFPVDLILAVRDGFNLDTAVGKQLDILTKYIGVSRYYTDENNQQAVLSDDEFRILLKLKMIINSGDATLYELTNSLYNLFGNGIRVVDDVNSGGHHIMRLTYFIKDEWKNVGLAAIQQDMLPHPTGVGYRYNIYTDTPYFGFVTYTDQSHPYTTGFRDYTDPTKDGQMYSYDKVVG